MLSAWRRWTDTLPDELTSVGRILQFPPVPEIPEPVRGQSFVVVEAIFCGDPVDGATWLEPMRERGPVTDTVAPMPVEGLSYLHMDPEAPVPGCGDGGMLADVDDELIDAFVERVVGAPFVSAEIRHLGGAVARPSASHGALASFDAPFLTYAVGMAPFPEAKQAVEHALAGWSEAIEPWAADHTYLNFAESRRDARSLFTEAAYHRLRRVKDAYDPCDVIRSNHPIA